MAKMGSWKSTLNWPFWVKFTVPCLLAFLLIVLVEALSIGTVNNLKAGLQDVVANKFNPSVELAGSVERLRAANGALYLLQVQQAAGLKPDVAAEAKKITDTLEQITAGLTRFKADYASASDKEKIDAALANLKNYQDAVGFVASMLELDFKTTVGFITPLGAAYEKMIADLSAVSGGFLASSRQESEAEIAAVNRKLVIVYTVTALSLLVVIGIILVIVRATILSINKLADATQKVAQGDTKIDFTALERGDELGRMVTALSVFRDNSARVAGLQAEQRASSEAAEAAKRQALFDLANNLERDVGRVVGNVVMATDGIRHLTEGMRNATGTAADLSNQASGAAADLTGNVETVAAATHELSASVAEVIRQVTETARIAQDAVNQTDSANATIRVLSEAASRIGNAAQLISDIASQTNLLSLNATIEAARAGDAGKGFAVVASEVKNLAAQTARATEEISAQIQQIQTATTDTVAAVQGVGQTITQISGIAAAVASAAEEQGAATEEISRNIQHAAEGTRQVSTDIVQVAQVAAGTGGSANEVVASVELLVAETTTLQGAITEFLTSVRKS